MTQEMKILEQRQNKILSELDKLKNEIKGLSENLGRINGGTEVFFIFLPTGLCFKNFNLPLKVLVLSSPKRVKMILTQSCTFYRCFKLIRTKAVRSVHINLPSKLPYPSPPRAFFLVSPLLNLQTNQASFLGTFFREPPPPSLKLVFQ